MNKIQEVKKRADIIKVAQYFNLNLNRAYKCVCPFHKEKTPSLSISERKQIWKCFGCGKGGDVINLVEELLHINAYESAKQINNILNLNIDFGKKTPSVEINKYQQEQKTRSMFKEWENKTFQMLCNYLHSLKGIQKYQEQDIVEYYIDMFIYGTEEDKLWFRKTEKRWCEQIERKLRKRNIA